MNNPLIFDVALGRTKPINIRNEDIVCPFCDTDHLVGILAQEGHKIWLKNKYPVLKDTWPTVIIETDDCDGEFSKYTLEEASDILRFSMEKWIETMNTGLYQSVLYFKNYGPMSGGSLRHPHSQIIGLKNYDYKEDIKSYHFDGWLLHDDGSIRITLSKHPLIGFFEYNLRFPIHTNPTLIAKRMQNITAYVLDSIASFSTSYNFFFYDLKDGYYYVKIIPRYITTPLFVGYKIPQTGNDERAQQIKKALEKYFKDH